MSITEKAKGAEKETVTAMGHSQLPMGKEKACMAKEMNLRMAKETETEKGAKEKAPIHMGRTDPGRWEKVVDL